MEEPLRILLVDDDEIDRMAARRALKATKLSMNLTEADGFQSAMAALTSQTFDCAIVDYQFPDGDGLTLLRAARAAQVQTPVITLTGHGDELVAVELMKAGAADYLSKAKLTAESLSRSLRSVLRFQQAEIQARQAEEALQKSEERYRSLVAATAQIVWTTSASGEFVAPQPEWSAFTGQTFEECVGWGWLTAIHPEDQWDTALVWSGAVDHHRLYEVEHRLRRRDGIYRAMQVRAVPVLEADGTVREWVGVHTDITERRRAEDALRFLAEASTILSSSLDYKTTLSSIARLAISHIADWCTVDMVGEEGTIQRVEIAHIPIEKQALAREVEQQHYPLNPDAPNGPAHVIRTGQSEMAAEISDTLLAANAQDAGHLSILREAGLTSYICVPLWARGRAIGAITLITTVSGRHYDAADLALAEELARRAAVAVDNARLYVEAQTRADRETLINRISRTARGTLDPDEILLVVTREVGRALGVSRCHWAEINPARDAFVIAPHQYVAEGIPPTGGSRPFSFYSRDVIAQWQAGEPVIISDLQQEGDLDSVRDTLLRSLRVHAYMACPVFLRGEWIGMFVVHQADRPRRWTPDEIALLCAVADMLALTLDNARLYAKEHRVADMLQAALLPDIPDRLPGLSLSTLYCSGLEESHVGGDLYDAFALPDGRVALVMADVSGKGLESAVQTATVKYSLRAFAAETAAPDLVLTRLNRTLCHESSGLGDHFVTLFYGVFDPASGRLSYASAGHESQIIKRAGGGLTLLESTGPILGIADHQYDQHTQNIDPGDALILFTDGLTEARAPGTRELLDLGRVVEAVQKARPESGAGALVSLLDDLARAWANGQPHDDMALLVARRAWAGAEETVDDAHGHRYSEQDTWLREKGEGEALFAFSFPSRPDYAAEVRQAVAHWMLTLGFSRVAVEDMQTAVTEAVTNAVRHGSRQGEDDQFHVAGFRTQDNALVVEVSDHGPGLPRLHTPPAMPEPEATGGRGLPLMQMLTDSLTYIPAEFGLCVRLTKKKDQAAT